jgi:hypothetical protein
MSTPQYDLLSSHPRNYLINGDFSIAQRAGSPYGGGYGIDRWNFGASGSYNAAVSQNTDVPTPAQSGYGLQVSLNLVCTVASTPAISDYAIIQQTIEGKFFAPLRNRKCTLSFWAKSSTIGTYGVSFKNSAASRSYVSSFLITQVGVWVQYTINVDFSQDTTGVYLYDNNGGVTVGFSAMAGTNYQTSSVNTFLNGNFNSNASQVNLMSTVGNYLRVSGVMFNEGGVAAPFALMGTNPMEEFQICQRYYQNLANLPGTASSASNFIFGTRLSPVMRATPSVSATGPLNAQGNATYSANQSGVSFGSLFPTPDSLYGNAIFPGNISTNISGFIAVIANNANYITLNAEL